MSEDLVKCPNCGSTQITSNKQGFSAGKAAAGFFLAGGVGLLAGQLGAGKVNVTCLKCGNKWEAGKPGPSREELNKPLTTGGKVALIIAALCFIATILIIAYGW